MPKRSEANGKAKQLPVPLPVISGCSTGRMPRMLHNWHSMLHLQRSGCRPAVSVKVLQLPETCACIAHCLSACCLLLEDLLFCRCSLQDLALLNQSRLEVRSTTVEDTYHALCCLNCCTASKHMVHVPSATILVIQTTCMYFPRGVSCHPSRSTSRRFGSRETP